MTVESNGSGVTVESLQATIEEERSRNRDLEQTLAEERGKLAAATLIATQQGEHEGRSEQQADKLAAAEQESAALRTEHEGCPNRLAAAEEENAALRRELERAREEQVTATLL